jgi:hypothetical protein
VVTGLCSVWVANSGDGSVTRISPRTGRVVGRISALGPSNSTTLAISGAAVWVSDYLDGPARLVRIDPASGRARGTHQIGYFAPCGDRHRLVLADQRRPVLDVLNPATSTVVATVHVPTPLLVGPRCLLGTTLYGTGLHTGRVYRVDLRTGHIATSRSSDAFGAPVLTPHTVAVTTADGAVLQLSRPTLRPVSRTALGVGQADNQAPTGDTYGFGHLWIVGFQQDGELFRP